MSSESMLPVALRATTENAVAHDMLQEVRAWDHSSMPLHTAKYPRNNTHKEAEVIDIIAVEIKLVHPFA